MDLIEKPEGVYLPIIEVFMFSIWDLVKFKIGWWRYKLCPNWEKRKAKYDKRKIYNVTGWKYDSKKHIWYRNNEKRVKNLPLWITSFKEKKW